MSTREQNQRILLARSLGYQQEKIDHMTREFTRAGEHLIMGRDSEAVSKLLALAWLFREQAQHLEWFISAIRTGNADPKQLEALVGALRTMPTR